MPYVYSTIGTDVAFSLFEPNAQPGSAARAVHTVTIKGGAGVMNDRIITPDGIRTQIDDAELRLLKNDQTFLRMESRGYLTVLESKEDPDTVATDMAADDGSKQATAKDFSDAKPKANK